MIARSILLVCLFLSQKTFAQINHVPVFPGLSSSLLQGKLIEDYTPNRILDYSIVRDSLFLNVDAIDRNLSCIYTNLTLPIPEGTDPTQAVFLNGANNGINTEHIYPLSLGTENTPAQSDMYNLFPSKVKTNADRGNLPYGDSPDNVTKKWYKEKDEFGSKPVSNIDDYSELGDGIFEPRENVKGDIARSMFYTYTIYKDFVDTQFFNQQKQTLCNWHFNDVVDEIEWKRTQKISYYQGNKNPFVLDCSLAARLYCENISNACSTVSVKEEEKSENIESYVKYDPSTSSAFIVIDKSYTLNIFNTVGMKIFSNTQREPSNDISFINLQHYPKGLYLLVLQLDGKILTKQIVVIN